MVLPPEGDPPESLSTRGSMGGAPCQPLPLLSGKKTRQHIAKGRADKLAWERVHIHKTLNLEGGSSTLQVTQQTWGEGALCKEMIQTVLFWAGLSVICNLYGYDKLHA